jgi:hypothetical protein
MLLPLALTTTPSLQLFLSMSITPTSTTDLVTHLIHTTDEPSMPTAARHFLSTLHSYSVHLSLFTMRPSYALIGGGCQCTDYYISLPPLHISFISTYCSDFYRLPPKSTTDLVTHLIHTTDEPSMPTAVDLHYFSTTTRLSLLPVGTYASSVPQRAFSSILWTSVPFVLDHWPSTQDRISDRVSTNLFIVLTLFSTIAHACS